MTFSFVVFVQNGGQALRMPFNLTKIRGEALSMTFDRAQIRGEALSMTFNPAYIRSEDLSMTFRDPQFSDFRNPRNLTQSCGEAQYDFWPQAGPRRPLGGLRRALGGPRRP